MNYLYINCITGSFKCFELEKEPVSSTSFKKTEFDTYGEIYEEKKGAHSNIMHVHYTSPTFVSL